MMTVDELLANREKAEADFKLYFEAQYASVDGWIREYDKWHRESGAAVDCLKNYKILDKEFITPTEAGMVEYDDKKNVKAVRIKVMEDSGKNNSKPIALCKEGIFQEGRFVLGEESYLIPIDRLFSIFVEMLEAYDNLNRRYI